IGDMNLNQSAAGYENTFISKSLSSLSEIFISVYSSEQEINLHWRGYESYMGTQVYSSGNIFNLIAGRGLGYLTDIGFYIKLGDESHRYIPVFHNGYIYLLVKTGIAGLLLYLIFLFRIIRFATAMDSGYGIYATLASRIIVGLIIILILTTVFIAGLFNKSTLTPAIILIGACLSHLCSLKRSRTHSPPNNIYLENK
ncbi:MAG: hypothetical protein PF495_13105, partial [Spirochaetales bacterium]|nr:hypothetical protein [Spirochaetales bacterium]